VTIHRFDLYALVSEAVTTPAAFGLTVVDTTRITPGGMVHAECTHPGGCLFWMASIRREPVTRFSRAGCAKSWLPLDD